MSKVYKIYFLLQSLIFTSSTIYSKRNQKVFEPKYNFVHISGMNNEENVLKYQIAQLRVVSPESIIENFCTGNVKNSCRNFKTMVEIIHKVYASNSNLKNYRLYIRHFEGIKTFNDFCLNKAVVKSLYYK